MAWGLFAAPLAVGHGSALRVARRPRGARAFRPRRLGGLALAPVGVGEVEPEPGESGRDPGRLPAERGLDPGADIVVAGALWRCDRVCPLVEAARAPGTGAERRPAGSALGAEPV